MKSAVNRDNPCDSPLCDHHFLEQHAALSSDSGPPGLLCPLQILRSVVPRPPRSTGPPSAPPQRARSDREDFAGYTLPDSSGRECQQGKEQPPSPQSYRPPVHAPTKGTVGPGKTSRLRPSGSVRSVPAREGAAPSPQSYRPPVHAPHKGRGRTGKTSRLQPSGSVRSGVPAREGAPPNPPRPTGPPSSPPQGARSDRERLAGPPSARPSGDTSKGEGHGK